METRTLREESTVEIGEPYPLGTYLVRILQGQRYRQLKLLKLN